MAKEEKKKVDPRDVARAIICEKYGKGAIMRLNSNEIVRVPSISTGCLSLDIALGIGGIPQGRIVEIYGPESSGKTTLTLHIAAECQKAGGQVAFIDAEHALDPHYAGLLGVDVDKLDIAQPGSGEEGLDIAEMLARSGAYRLVIVDSVAALTPQKELDGDFEDINVGLQARMMAKAMRRLTAAANDNNCTIIFINQIRMKIGVMFGNPETTPGGRALPFHASVRIEIRKQVSKVKKDGEDIIAHQITMKTVKNKVAPPLKSVTSWIYFGKGIYKPADVLELCTQFKIIQKSGAWFSYQEKNIGQGAANTEAFLESNPELMIELERKIKHVVLTGEIPE